MNRFLTLGAVLAVSAMCTAEVAAQAKPADYFAETSAAGAAEAAFTFLASLAFLFAALLA